MPKKGPQKRFWEYPLRTCRRSWESRCEICSGGISKGDKYYSTPGRKYDTHEACAGLEKEGKVRYSYLNGYAFIDEHGKFTKRRCDGREWRD